MQRLVGEWYKTIVNPNKLKDVAEEKTKDGDGTGYTHSIS